MIISDNKAQKNKKGGRDMRDIDDVAANEVEINKIRATNATETNNLVMSSSGTNTMQQEQGKSYGNQELSSARPNNLKPSFTLSNKHRFVQFDITRQCNLRCAHCRSTSFYEGSQEHEAIRDMSTEEVYKALDSLSAAGVERITFLAESHFSERTCWTSLIMHRAKGLSVQ